MYETLIKIKRGIGYRELNSSCGDYAENLLFYHQSLSTNDSESRINSKCLLGLH